MTKKNEKEEDALDRTVRDRPYEEKWNWERGSDGCGRTLI